MKIFQVTKLNTSKDKLMPYYFDEDHLIDFLSKLPLSEPVTIGLLVDDTILNNYEYEVQE